MTGLRDRIAYAIAQADGDEPGMEPASCDYEMADAVIRELRPQLAAWAQTCVDSGDMTPAAQRELHKILGSKHDRH